MTRLFDKILIANRGEIAVRVISTARAMGIKTVAVFSDADADALHVDMADEAVRIGAPPPGESYLKGDRILEAARRTGARAIHPGYGFLSENADFARDCVEAGLAFIGPPAEAIAKMGLKDEAKRLMQLADVPVVPGYLGEDQSEERLLAEAREIGFPVLIKAVAGGGGKGMRKVGSAEAFEDALAAARREAKGAFGDERVLVEKCIEVPRHIEIQVFADSHGNAVHLFERDCSLQRRHQKVVEEAPAPGMTEAMRDKMGRAAVAAAQAIGYVGAGTVEFIVDVANGLADAPFYFMEMNTRLQVEHPVTELITGEDLVEWQIRVAAGELLPRVQDDIDLDGHAIEVRLYAENPAQDFLPATGRLERFRPPADADFLRVDTGVREGDTVGEHYDPMIAKIIAWGEDREAALAHLVRGLEETEVAGLTTNLAFLRRAAGHPEFAAGAIDTGFIPRHIDELVDQPASPGIETLALACLGLLAARYERAAEAAAASEDPVSPWHWPSGWQPNLPIEEVQRFEDATGTEIAVTITRVKEGYRVETDGESVQAALRSFEQDGALEVEIDGRTLQAVVLAGQESMRVIRAGRTETLRRLSAKFDPDEEAEGPGTLTAPMPGKILELRVGDGETVEKGQTVLLMEAMKMEYTLTAPRAGTLAGLAVEIGSQVAEGELLARIEEA